MNNWSWVILIILALTVLIILLWRNFDIEEITPTPPFIKLKRKVKSAPDSAPFEHLLPANSTNIKKNWIIGKNRVSIHTTGVNVDTNKLVGENRIEVGLEHRKKPTRKGN